MVSWLEIRTSIEKNPRNGYSVFKIPLEFRKPIDKYPILYTTESAPVVEKVVASVVKEVRAVAKSSLPTPSTHQIDPIVIGIADGLYENATYTTKRQMECEEAQRLEGLIASLYASQGGRSRGWTKSGLEACIRPRCSSGGDLRTLDKAKSTFPWSLIRTDKVVSAFLDFLCVSKGVRVAVWFQEEKTVVIYPAADRMGSDTVANYPLFHVSHNGFILRAARIQSGADLVALCEDHGFTYIPPYSVSHSLSNLKVDELNSVASKLGMSELSGTKAERVEKISQYKLRQRLIPVRT
jgi:hypothetical protein